SAFFAGIGGALYAALVGFVSPDSFSLVFSLQFLVMIVVGGLASIPGAILGALAIFELGLRLAPPLTEQLTRLVPGVSTQNPWGVYGVVLILAMIFAPGGLWGLARRSWQWLLRRGSPRTARQQTIEAAAAAGPLAKTAEPQ